MDIKEFFKTNCCLRYREFAYFIKLGNKYFCVGTNDIVAQEQYTIGCIYSFEDYEIEKIVDIGQKQLIWKEFKTNKVAHNLLSSIQTLLNISENNDKRDAYTLQCAAMSVLVDFDIL